MEQYAAGEGAESQLHRAWDASGIRTAGSWSTTRSNCALRCASGDVPDAEDAQGVVAEPVSRVHLSRHPALDRQAWPSLHRSSAADALRRAARAIPYAAAPRTMNRRTVKGGQEIFPF